MFVFSVAISRDNEISACCPSSNLKKILLLVKLSRITIAFSTDASSKFPLFNEKDLQYFSRKRHISISVKTLQSLRKFTIMLCTISVDNEATFSS